MRRLVGAATLIALLSLVTGARQQQKLGVPEEFGIAAAKALDNITEAFNHFIAAARQGSTELSKKIKDEQQNLADLAGATSPGAKSAADLRQANDVLRARAQTLISGNEALRTQLLQARQQLNEDFSSQATLGSQAGESALLTAAEHPTAAPAVGAEAAAGTDTQAGRPVAAKPQQSDEAMNDLEETLGMPGEAPAANTPQLAAAEPAEASSEPEQSLEDVMRQQVTRQALLQVSHRQEGQSRLQGVMPTLTPAGPSNEDLGYAEAFASGDADGSSDAWGLDQDAQGWQSFLSLQAHHRRLRTTKAEERLWPAAVAFAKLEGAGVQKVQELYAAAMKKVEKQRAELLEQKATHMRLSSAVAKLETTHSHLMTRSHSLLGMLESMHSAALVEKHEQPGREEGAMLRGQTQAVSLASEKVQGRQPR